MHIDALLSRDCVDVNSCVAPTCNCPGQTCVFINKSCQSCAYFECQSLPSSAPSSSGGGVSAGAVAGAVVGSLIFLGLAFGAFLWYRRRARSSAATEPEVKDVPAAAADVLNRPDPMEKHHSTTTSAHPTEMNTVRVYSTSSNTTIDLDPESQASTHHTNGTTTQRSSMRSNPFEDSHSIQTTGTEGTNVIPIALVAPDSQRHSLSATTESESSRSAASPMRPARSPDLDLNLEHVNVSNDSVRTPAHYPQSTRSGVSAVTRNSYMSSASYSSDFLNEAPMIITANKGPVRQVLGVVKAEMINAPGHSPSQSPTTSEGLKPAITSRPAVRSPLAATAFGPADIGDTDSASVSMSEDGSNPFSDKHSSTRTTMADSPAPSRTDFSEPPTARESDWTPVSGPRLPWSQTDGDSRPSSISTQAGSVIDIANATRVNLGLSHLTSESGAPTPRTPYRTTMGKLVSPPTGGDQSTFEQQQQRALAHAQAQAQAQGGDPSRRISASSAMSGTSTRADSILESFPFVPPSPISNRPPRSPPLSPLAQQAFNVTAPSPVQQTFTAPPSKDASKLASEIDLPAPPDRRTLGLSTGSQLSTASTGLGSFPFQIDTGSSRDSGAPSSYSGRQRASLDTLAITSDLSSFPLGFDRDSVTSPLPHRK